MLIKSTVHGFAHKVYTSTAGLWVPLLDILVPKHHNILCVLGTPGGKVLFPAHNIVTDMGDRYYAQRAVSETPTDTFARLYLSAVNWDGGHPAKGSVTDNIASVIAGTEKAATGTYPKTADADADNTGAGVDVVTWAFSYTKADFNAATIEAGALAAAAVTSWGAGAGVNNLLTAFDLTTFAKTANDTLKVFVNHTMNGV
jgi:hypothetical protein